MLNWDLFLWLQCLISCSHSHGDSTATVAEGSMLSPSKSPSGLPQWPSAVPGAEVFIGPGLGPDRALTLWWLKKTHYYLGPQEENGNLTIFYRCLLSKQINHVWGTHNTSCKGYWTSQKKPNHKASLSPNYYPQSPPVATNVYFWKHNDREPSISKSHVLLPASAALFPAVSAFPFVAPLLPQKRTCKYCSGSWCMSNFSPWHDVPPSIPPMQGHSRCHGFQSSCLTSAL